METTVYYALGLPLYLALIGAELFVTRRRGMRVYGFANTVGNISAGLGEVVLGLFIGPYLLALYDYAYTNWRLIDLEALPPWLGWLPWVMAFLLADLGYYVYHRAGHSVAALWAIHGVHHQSDRFNFTIAMRHPWLSDSYSFIFYAPIPLLGVSTTQFFVAITIISFYALTVHSQVFHRPGLGFLVTPRTHIVHHARNPRYLGKNLGAMFTIWDKLFGTHVEIDPDDPPQLGTPSGYETHDGARAQWVFWRDVLHASRQGRGLKEKAMAFLKHPGWIPQGATRHPRREAPAEASVPVVTRIYVAAQFTATVGFSVYILWLRDQHPFAVLVLAAVAILLSISSLGGLLDGRRRAVTWELGRLGLVACVGLGLLAWPAYLWVGLALVADAAIGGVWALSIRQKLLPSVERDVGAPG